MKRPLYVSERLLDVTAKLPARSIEARFDCFLWDGKALRSLRGAQTFYFAEHENGPKILRQAVDRGS